MDQCLPGGQLADGSVWGSCEQELNRADILEKKEIGASP